MAVSRVPKLAMRVCSRCTADHQSSFFFAGPRGHCCCRFQQSPAMLAHR